MTTPPEPGPQVWTAEDVDRAKSAPREDLAFLDADDPAVRLTRAAALVRLGADALEEAGALLLGLDLEVARGIGYGVASAGSAARRCGEHLDEAGGVT